MGPYTIIIGPPLPSYSNFKLEFGQYVQTHNHPSKTNNMRPRTTPAIALKFLGSQNGWHFISLKTGKRILRYKWTFLPMPENVIERMYESEDKFKLKKKGTNAPIAIDEIIESEENERNFDKHTTETQSNQTYEDEPKEFNESPLNYISNLDSDYSYDNISDLTISQHSKKMSENLTVKFQDIFEESTLEELDEMEDNTTDNENNLFIDANDEVYNQLESIVDC